MIPRISLAVSRRAAIRLHKRHYAAQTSPSPKITVVPFRQSPQSAMDRLHTFALMASARPSNAAAAFLRFCFGSFGQLIAESLGLGAKLSLKEMKAVYYPIWRTDAMFEGKVWREGDKDKTIQAGLIGARGVYVPGNSFAPLSYISFAVPPLEEDLNAYEPNRDLQQLGDGFDIVPIPFVASPIGLLKNMKKRIGQKVTIDGATFDMTTWRAALVACYPIMFPLYIADFEYEAGDGSKRTLNTVMDAHDENLTSCRISCPPVPEVRDQNPGFAKNYWINPAPFAPEKALFVPYDPFASLSPEEIDDEKQGNKFIQIVKAPKRELASAFDEWMSPAPTSQTSVPPSPMYEVEQEGGGIDWNDARIQSWSGPELSENEAYYAAAVDYRAKSAEIKRLEQDKKIVAALPGPDASMPKMTRVDAKKGVQTLTIDEFLVELRNDEKEARRRYWEAKPAWLKRYEAALIRKEKEAEAQSEAA